MPFIQMVDQTRSKLRLSDVKPPILIGIVALVLAVLVIVGVNAFSAFSGDGFVVSKDGEAAASSSDSQLASDAASRKGSEDATAGKDAGSAAGDLSQEELAVYVCGEVEKPGVYAFKQGERLQNAINAAGGFTSDAAQDALNLARLLQDGEQVKVPSIEEQEAASVQQASANDAALSASPSSAGGLISINTASASELESLPGIGQATAAKIIASREGEGPFQSVDDLLRVSGIGEKKLEAIRDLVCL